MSLRSLEADILRELKRLPGLSKIRQKDIMEWSTAPVTAQDGEIAVHLPENHVYVAYKLPASPRATNG